MIDLQLPRSPRVSHPAGRWGRSGLARRKFRAAWPHSIGKPRVPSIPEQIYKVYGSPVTPSHVPVEQEERGQALLPVKREKAARLSPSMLP